MRLIALLCALALALPAAASEVGEILDATTLLLADGRKVRLAGIEAAPSPAAPKAVRELVLGRAVLLEQLGTDRHRRVRAHLRREDGLWLQGALLERGLARVSTAPDDRAYAAEMLAIEAAARGAGRGFWAHPAWTVRSPELARRFVDSYQLVEGRVLAAARVRNQVFLNFGPDRKTDFTARIPGPALKRWRAAGLDPLALAGARVRLRGWLRLWDGPLVELSHPEQVERLP
jgi:micrococcal nuclease